MCGIVGYVGHREAVDFLIEGLHRLEYRADEIETVASVEERAQKVAAALAGRKTAAPTDAYAFLEKAPAELLVFILAESSNSKAVAKIKTYLSKWRPLRQALPERSYRGGRPGGAC